MEYLSMSLDNIYIYIYSISFFPLFFGPIEIESVPIRKGKNWLICVPMKWIMKASQQSRKQGL